VTSCEEPELWLRGLLVCKVCWELSYEVLEYDRPEGRADRMAVLWRWRCCDVAMKAVECSVLGKLVMRLQRKSWGI